MTEKVNLNNKVNPKDDESLLKTSKLTEEENYQKIRKSKTLRNSTKPKTLRSSSKNLKASLTNRRKVKFNEKIEFINIECWKIYNAEQTADENFEAIFVDYEKDDKEKLNNDKNDNKKRNSKKDTISCTCIII